MGLASDYRRGDGRLPRCDQRLLTVGASSSYRRTNGHDIGLPRQHSQTTDLGRMTHRTAESRRVCTALSASDVNPARPGVRVVSAMQASAAKRNPVSDSFCAVCLSRNTLGNRQKYRRAPCAAVPTAVGKNAQTVNKIFRKRRATSGRQIPVSGGNHADIQLESTWRRTDALELTFLQQRAAICCQARASPEIFISSKVRVLACFKLADCEAHAPVKEPSHARNSVASSILSEWPRS